MLLCNSLANLLRAVIISWQLQSRYHEHLRTYGLSKSQGDIDDEVDLILCRAGGSNQYFLLCLLKGKIKSVKRKLTKYRSVHARNRRKFASQYWNLDCWIKRNRDFITIIFNNFKNKITKIKGKLF